MFSHINSDRDEVYPTLPESIISTEVDNNRNLNYLKPNDLTIIGSDNGLLPGLHQAIIWTNAETLLIGSLGTNLSEILTQIQTFPLKKNAF